MDQGSINPAAPLYRARSRSLRLRGVSTSIRLENLFWQALEEAAGRRGLSLSQWIARQYEAWRQGAEASVNFSSYLRVGCLCELSPPGATSLAGEPGLAVARIGPQRQPSGAAVQHEAT